MLIKFLATVVENSVNLFLSSSLYFCRDSSSNMPQILPCFRFLPRIDGHFTKLAVCRAKMKITVTPPCINYSDLPFYPAPRSSLMAPRDGAFTMSKGYGKVTQFLHYCLSSPWIPYLQSSARPSRKVSSAHSRASPPPKGFQFMLTMWPFSSSLLSKT